MTVSIITFIGHTRAVKRVLDQNSHGGEVEMKAPKDVLVRQPRFEDPDLTPKPLWSVQPAQSETLCSGLCQETGGIISLYGDAM